jgi:hypothetical protein
MPIPKPVQRLGVVPAAFAASIALAGCAADLPTHEIAHARDAIIRAQEDGAPQLAGAAFVMSQETLAKAKAAADKGEYSQARRLAEQSAVDAHLASATARAIQAEKTANDVVDPQGIQHRQTRTAR